MLDMGGSAVPTSRGSWIAIALALLLALPASAQEAAYRLEGTWSRDLDGCSLSEDEDESRFQISGSEFRDYGESCRIGSRSTQRDGTLLVTMSCGRNDSRLMRVFPKGPEKAVFYLFNAKRQRSRDLMRCPRASVEEAAIAPDLLEDWNSIRDPRRLTKRWLEARRRCRSEVTAARAEACAERRHLGSMLRSMRLCHFTRGSREGWRSCS